MTFNRSPLESNLVRKVKTYITTTFLKEAWILKTVGNASQRSGVPDIICCIQGKFIAIETKREDGSGEISNQQTIEAKCIKNAGGWVIISDNFNEIKKFINNIFEIQ